MRGALLGLGTLLLLLACEVRSMDAALVSRGDENGDGRLTGADIERLLERCEPGCRIQLAPGVYEDVALEIDRSVSIAGAGRTLTTLRAPAPATGPVVHIAGGVAAFAIEALTIDGRRSEQTQPRSIKDHVGIRVSNVFARDSPDGRIRDVEVRDFLTAGILIRNGQGWRVEDSTVRSIGCHETHLPCPRLRTPGRDPHMEGRVTVGYGILLSGAGASRASITGNLVSDVTKIGIEAFTTNSSLGSADRVRDVVIRGNTVQRSLAAGIVSNGGQRITIDANSIRESGGRGVRGHAGNGIACGGASEEITISNNVVETSLGPGIRVTCLGDDVEVSGNRTTDACAGEHRDYGAMHVVGRKEGSRNVVIRNERIDNSASGCKFGLFVARWNEAAIDDVVVRGGSKIGIFVNRSRDVRLSGLSTDADVPLWTSATAERVELRGEPSFDVKAIRSDGDSAVVLLPPERPGGAGSAASD